MNIILHSSKRISLNSCIYKQILPLTYSINTQQKRQNSSYVETAIRNQSGIFKSLSESAPVEYLQNFLLYAHDVSGLPWWFTIVCSTIAIRSCVTVPLAIYQQNILAKVENINAEMPKIAKELAKEMHVAVGQYKWDERTAQFFYRRSIKKQWSKLIERDNCHPLKAGILVLFQIPLWVCFSTALRNLVYQLPVADASAQITHLELTLGGFGWIQNLTIPDSTLLLPLSLGIFNLLIVEIQSLSKIGEPTKFRRYVSYLFRTLSVAMIPIAACVPSCLSLYWTISSAVGLVQNVVLMSPKVRRMCRIPQTHSELENPYRHVLDGFKKKYFIS